eukprot:gene34346-44367_t
MATRNLTKKFLEIRNTERGSRTPISRKDRKNSEVEDRDSHGLLTSSASKANDVKDSAASAQLPPEWVDAIEMIEDDVSKINKKMDDLEALFKKRLLVDFESDENAQEREIELKTNEITSIFKHAERKLNEFAAAGRGSTNTAVDLTVRKNLQISMARKLQGLSTTFRQKQRRYMTSLKGQSAAAGNNTIDIDYDTNQGSTVVEEEFRDTGFSKSQIIAVEESEQEVRRRDAEIIRIAQSIEELAAIFQELAKLVIDQGTILDRIDFNMENAVEDVTKGVVELHKAEENQKNAMSIRCIILLVMLIIIMLGVLIWKHSPSSK